MTVAIKKPQKSYRDIFFCVGLKVLLLGILSCCLFFFAKPHITTIEVQRHLFSK